MKKIVAIGGGDIRKRSTLAIDQEIIRLSGKKSPSLLFIPTASSDNEGYWKHIQRYFGSLGCVTDVLVLLTESLTPDRLKAKILSADIIYVGGGNTLKMMRLWRRLGIDKLLKEAYNKGIVMCGISAGSICWFESGHSDSMSFYNPTDWDYIKVTGMGLINGIHCPHYDSATRGVKRRSSFHTMIKKSRGMGIALDDNAALIYCDDSYRIITSRDKAAAYRVYTKRGTVVEERIEPSKQLRPNADLYKKGGR